MQICRSCLILIALMCIMEDAKGNIQGTGQEQRPARMVGLLSLDSPQDCKEAANGNQQGRCDKRGMKPALSPSHFHSARSAPTSPTRAVSAIDRSRIDPATLSAAEGMETLFLDYMMQVMRQSVPKNAMGLDSPAVEIYRGLLDTEYAKKAAKRGGIGLADQIIAYLQARGYNLNQRQVSPNKEKTMRVNQTGTSPVQNTETKKTSATSQKTKAAPNDAAQKTPPDLSGAKPDISTKSKEFSQAKAIAAQAPDVREEKVAELKKRIEEGKYNVKPEAVAEQLVDDHVKMSELS